MQVDQTFEYDLFISHASEDKDDFVRPLAKSLSGHGLKVWFDEFTLTLGDSLRKEIDKGLGNSKFGIVVLSNSFFEKDWPQAELDGLMALEVDGRKVILPIWHNVFKEDIAGYSPILAGRLGIRSSKGLPEITDAILKTIEAESIKTETTTGKGREKNNKTIRRILRKAYDEQDNFKHHANRDLKWCNNVIRYAQQSSEKEEYFIPSWDWYKSVDLEAFLDHEDNTLLGQEEDELRRKIKNIRNSITEHQYNDAKGELIKIQDVKYQNPTAPLKLQMCHSISCLASALSSARVDIGNIVKILEDVRLREKYW